MTALACLSSYSIGHALSDRLTMGWALWTGGYRRFRAMSRPIAPQLGTPKREGSASYSAGIA